MHSRRRLFLLLAAVVAVALAVYFVTARQSRQLVLTGIVSGDDFIVSPQIQGRIEKLLVNQGDIVETNQLLALLQPQEWNADVAFYSESAKQNAAQVAEAEAELKYQELQTTNQVRQGEATLAATQAQVTQASADLENARLTFAREEDLYHRGVEPVQAYDQARTTYDALRARVESLRLQVNAAEAAVALARSSAQQVAVRRAALEASASQHAAANAQTRKAEVRLGYTEVRAPISGIVDIRAALPGEVLNPGQAIVTLINPDALWVRADVEETYIDLIHLGDKFQVRLPSGALKQGTVFYRAVDADYATQRDVSRTKRDIKTFEVRLRCDNADRSLALGMTAYVALPLPHH
jgi:HlyD family secretion protein